jgi:hypothetical protein
MPVQSLAGKKKQKADMPLFSGSLIVPIARYNFNPLPRL